MRRLLFVLFAALVPLSAHAGDGKKEKAPPVFQPKLRFSYGDDNLLVGAGETKKSSPAAYFGGECNKTSLDRTTPTDCSKNALNMIFYTRLTLEPYFQPEAAVNLLVDVEKSVFQDDGSYLRANYFMDDQHETFWAITLFPFDADRLRLGYFQDVQWGGTNSFPKNLRRAFAPGLKFDLDYRYWHVFVGMKTALVRSPTDDILDNKGGNTLKNVERTFYGFLGGAGFEFSDTGLRLELNGGFFNKGTNTRRNALGQPIYAGGVSARFSWSSGLPIGRQIDLRIYQQDPIRDELFKREAMRHGDLSFRAEIEASELAQDLEDPDHVDSTKNEWSTMGHVGFGMKYGFFRLFADVIARELTAITFDVPGFVPNQALPDNVKVTPEVFGSVGFDYTFDPYGITIGGSVGVLKPATYEGVPPEPTNASPVDQGSSKTVVRGPSPLDWDILPQGEDELPVYMVRFDFRWVYYEAFGVAAQVYYGRDENTAQVEQDSFGHNVRVFQEPNTIGFQVLTQMKF